MKFVKVKRVKTPTRGTSLSAGIDFFVPSEFAETVLHPGEHVNIPSGLHVRVPKGHALIMMDKSGIATKQRLKVGACVIDEDYQGEVHLHVVNIGSTIAKIIPDQKLVQGLLLQVNYAEVEEFDELSELYEEKTERGSGGFGSTGLH